MTTNADAKPNCEHVVAACGKAYPKRFRSGDGYSVLGEIGLLYNRLFPKIHIHAPYWLRVSLIP